MENNTTLFYPKDWLLSDEEKLKAQMEMTDLVESYRNFSDKKEKLGKATIPFKESN